MSTDGAHTAHTFSPAITSRPRVSHKLFLEMGGHYILLRNGPHFCPPKCPNEALGVIAACPSWFKSSAAEAQTYYFVLRASRWPDRLRIEQFFCLRVISLSLPLLLLFPPRFFSGLYPFLLFEFVCLLFLLLIFPFSFGANSSSVPQDTSNKNNLVRGWLLVFSLLYFYDCMHMLLLALLLNSSRLIIFYSLLIFLNYIIGHINYHLSCILIQTAAQLPIKRNVWPWCTYCSHSTRRGPHAPRRTAPPSLRPHPFFAPPTPLLCPAHTLSSPCPYSPSFRQHFAPPTVRRPARSHHAHTHLSGGTYIGTACGYVCLYPWRFFRRQGRRDIQNASTSSTIGIFNSRISKIIFKATVLLTDPFFLLHLLPILLLLLILLLFFKIKKRLHILSRLKFLCVFRIQLYHRFYYHKKKIMLLHFPLIIALFGVKITMYLTDAELLHVEHCI